ncbi:MAG: Ig domain-containing protein, partial [Microbacteriaceae bacterium]
MRILRALFTGALAVLFSGVLAPLTLVPAAQSEQASAADTSGLKFTAYRANASYPERSTTRYTVCATGTVSNINWDVGGGDIHGCGGDFVMVRYYGYISNPTTQTMFFRGYSDDGISMKIGGTWINGVGGDLVDATQVINEWVLRGCGSQNVGSFAFTSNVAYPVEVWMYEYGGGACAKIHQSTSSNGTFTAVPSTQFDQVGVEAAAFTEEAVKPTTVRDEAYSDSVAATGGGAVSYALQSGALPNGLTLNTATGAITGVPTTNGTYSFSIRASSVSGSTTTTDDTPSLTITVGVPPSVGAIDSSSTIAFGTPATMTVADAIGYPSPTYAVSSGSLPSGLTLNSATGSISGTPNGSG